nr:SAM-dependent methyltransferase [Amycolatopsis sp. CA-230715]
MWRKHHEIGRLFGDFELISPGLAWTTEWHPEDSSPTKPELTFTAPNESVILAGVGRKP